MEKQSVTFGFVHGAWHGAWCWEFLQEALGDRGYKSIAVELPIEDPHCNFDDYARATSERLQDEKELVLVGHSRAGNVIPRVAGQISVQQLIYVAPSFDDSSLNSLSTYNKEKAPQKFSQEFLDGIIKLDNELTAYDPEVAKRLFYNDCSPQMQQWAVNQLRLQRRSENEPAIENWPIIEQAYIICDDDKIINREWSEFIATECLQIDPIVMPGGHSPFLSQHEPLASTLISLVDSQRNII